MFVCSCHGVAFPDCPNQQSTPEDREIQELRTRVEALQKALEEGIQIANNAATSGRNGWQLGAADRRLAEVFVEAARKLLEPK